MTKLTAAVLTLSDKGSRGERDDLSGKRLIELAGQLDIEIAHYEILPDEYEILREKLIELADIKQVDFVFTTGGTGLSPRDITPEATLSIAERLVPGIGEAMRMESMKFTNRAMLSRAVAVVRKKTLIVNLPGSEKGASECFEIVAPVLGHAAELLSGVSAECGRK